METTIIPLQTDMVSGPSLKQSRKRDIDERRGHNIPLVQTGAGASAGDSRRLFDRPDFVSIHIVSFAGANPLMFTQAPPA
jgi:hypothetical protein